MKEDLFAAYQAGRLDGKRAAEREITELRKDKERLDWLLDFLLNECNLMAADWMLEHIDGRDDIDAEMKEEA